jgi:hypothetical protein
MKDEKTAKKKQKKEREDIIPAAPYVMHHTESEEVVNTVVL